MFHNNISLNRECFTDLKKNKICLSWLDFRREPIYTTAPAATKNDAQFKSGQNQLKNKQLALLI